MPEQVPIELDPGAARWWLQQGALALDVRSAAERAEGAIPGSLAIPVTELGSRWRELPADRPLVVYCSAGTRAFRAAVFLRERGLAAAHLVGGFSEWSSQRLPLEAPSGRGVG